MSTAVIGLEGVLQESPEFHITAQLSPAGRSLYEALAHAFRLVVLTDADSEPVDHWLRTNGLTRHSHILTGDRIASLRSLRAGAAHISLVVDTALPVFSYARETGLAALLYGAPLAVGAAPRPIREWDA